MLDVGINMLVRCNEQSIVPSYQRSINTTPFELSVGAKMKNKEDLEVHQTISQEIRGNFSQEREDLRIKAKESILKVQEENQRGYNKKRKDSTKYKEGDLVAIQRTQFGGGLKLKPKFLGPYQVTKLNRNDRYDVEKLNPNDEGPGNTSSAADHMKPWPEGQLIDYLD